MKILGQFALSRDDFMSIEWEQSTNVKNIFKILFENHKKNNEKTCRFRSLMEIERQILIKQEIACNWGFLY